MAVFWQFPDVLDIRKMKELYNSNDPVTLSWLTALLKDAGIEAFVFGSFLTEGRAGYFGTSQQLMVADEDYTNACATLSNAGFKPAK